MSNRRNREERDKHADEATAQPLPLRESGLTAASAHCSSFNDDTLTALSDKTQPLRAKPAQMTHRDAEISAKSASSGGGQQVASCLACSIAMIAGL